MKPLPLCWVELYKTMITSDARGLVLVDHDSISKP